MRRIAPLLSLLPLLLAACSDQSEPGPTASEAALPEPAVTDEAASPAATATGGPESRYTSLKDCKLEELREEEDWSVSRCTGPGGYTLMVDYGDARDDLRLIKPGGKPVELGLLALTGGGFNALGDVVEWRGSGAGEMFRPAALIVRNNAVETPERPEQPTAFLVVVDLSQACVVAQVRPMSGQNEAARKVADGPKQPCLKGSP